MPVVLAPMVAAVVQEVMVQALEEGGGGAGSGGSGGNGAGGEGGSSGNGSSGGVGVH